MILLISISQEARTADFRHTWLRQLLFHEGSKNIQWRKDSLLNKLCWDKWVSTCKRMLLVPHFTPYKNKLKMNYRCKHKTGKCEATSENGAQSHGMGLDKGFGNMNLKAQATKVKVDKWDNIKLKSF
jgi:hypothetical protein